MKVISAERPEDLTRYINAIFDKIGLATADAVNAELEKIGKEATAKLKADSPKRKGGKYARGWRYRVTKVSADGSFSLDVYNGKYGWLTHLLENDHMLISKGVVVGHVKGQPHILPVADWVETEGMRRIYNAIEQNIQGIKTE